MRFAILAALGAATLLAACSPDEPQPDPCLAATDVKQCEAIAMASGGQRHSSNDGLLTGLMLGHMMGGGGGFGGGSSHHTTVVNNHYSTKTFRGPSYYTSKPRSSWGSSSYRSSFRSSSFGRRR